MRKVKQMQKGLSLVELMVTVGIMGIVAAIALPMYNDYVDSAEISVINDNMTSIILFEEEYRLSTGSYHEGEYDPADPGADDGLKTKIGWDPRNSTDGITYIVLDKSASGFKIKAADSAGTELHSRDYTR